MRAQRRAERTARARELPGQPLLLALTLTPTFTITLTPTLTLTLTLTSQVNRLLDVTVKRNAELVDSLSQLQAQVERLASTRQAKKPVRKVSKKKDADKDKPTKPKVAAK